MVDAGCEKKGIRETEMKDDISREKSIRSLFYDESRQSCLQETTFSMMINGIYTDKNNNKHTIYSREHALLTNPKTFWSSFHCSMSTHNAFSTVLKQQNIHRLSY